MIAIEDAQKLVSDMKNDYAFLEKVKIKVYNNPSEIWKGRKVEDLEGITGAAYPNLNTVVVFSDAHEDMEALKRTLKHEILGHLGLKMLGDKNKEKIIDSILEAPEGSYSKKLFDKVEKKYSHINDKRNIAEEVFAYTAEASSVWIPANNPTTNVENLWEKNDILSVVDLVKRDMYYGYRKIQNEPFLAKDENALYASFGGRSDEDIMNAVEASKNVYDEEPKTSDFLIPITKEELERYGVTSTENKKTGFKASFNHDSQGNVIMAFKGTAGVKDWIYGNPQGLGFYTAQYKQAAVLSKEALKAFGDNLLITGHSLGGGLATQASAITKRPAVTFNPAGLHEHSLDVNEIDFSRFKNWAEDGNVKRYVVEGEILNWIQDHSPLPSSMGIRENLKHATLISPFAKHKMQAVEEALAQTKEKNSLTHAILRRENTEVLVPLIEKEKSEKVLGMLLGNEDVEIMIALAKNENTPTELLVALSGSSQKEVRVEVVKNSSLPIEKLFSMRKDKDDEVSNIASTALYGKIDSINSERVIEIDENFIAKVRARNAQARKENLILTEEPKNPLV